MMKDFLIIGSVLLLTISCKEQEERRSALRLDKEIEQTYSITSSQDTVIVGGKGTRIKLPRGCFVDAAGKQVSGDIKITLKEYYSIQDFVSNRLSTTSTDGRILTSSGMIFLEAKSGNNTLRLKSTSPATIMFPRLVDSNVANLFVGQVGKNDEIQWQQLDPVHYDTIVLMARSWMSIIESDSASDDKWLTKIAYPQVKFVIGSDTIPLTTQNREQFDKVLQRTTGYLTELESSGKKAGYTVRTAYEKIKFYIFQTTDLGYLNCDIFVDEALDPFTVKVTDLSSDVLIIMDSLTAVIYPDSVIDVRMNGSVNGVMLFNLPKNKAVTVVSYKVDANNKYHFGVLKSNTSAKEVSVREEPVTLDQIKAAIKQL